MNLHIWLNKTQPPLQDLGHHTTMGTEYLRLPTTRALRAQVERVLGLCSYHITMIKLATQRLMINLTDQPTEGAKVPCIWEAWLAYNTKDQRVVYVTINATRLYFKIFTTSYSPKIGHALFSRISYDIPTRFILTN